MRKLFFVLVIAALAAVPATAQDSEKDLAKKAQNPIGNMISLPLQNNTSFNIGPYDRTHNVLNIQPVAPFFDGKLITRTILPIVTMPDLASESGSTTGIGDLNFTAWYVPRSGEFMWGVGGVAFLPTGGDDLGSEKWSAGPSVVLLTTKGKLVAGFLANNVWSFAGEEAAGDVNQFLLQYFINYNFGETGWYLVSAPIITADWTRDSGDQWTLPLGGGFGRVFNIGAQPVNMSLQAYDNVIAPEGAPDWQLRFQVQLLFPQ